MLLSWPPKKENRVWYNYQFLSKEQEYERELYGKLVNYEARGEPLIGKLAVLQIAINRQKKHNISLDSVLKKGFNRNPGFFDYVLKSDIDSSILPFIPILKKNPIHDYLYFYNPKTSTDKAFLRKLNKKIKFKINNHEFTDIKK